MIREQTLHQLKKRCQFYFETNKRGEWKSAADTVFKLADEVQYLQSALRRIVRETKLTAVEQREYAKQILGTSRNSEGLDHAH